MISQSGILLFVMIISPLFLGHMKPSFEIGNNSYILEKIQFKISSLILQSGAYRIYV